MDAVKHQIAGYGWSITLPRWKPIFVQDAERQFASTQFNKPDAYGEYLKHIAEGHEGVTSAWIAFKQGVEDSGHIFIDDDNDGVLLDTNIIARVTGFNRSYVKAEIKAGRLKATKDGREHRVTVDDYLAWATPKFD